MVLLMYTSAECPHHVPRCVSVWNWHFPNRHVAGAAMLQPGNRKRVAGVSPAGCVTLKSLGSWVNLVLNFSLWKHELSSLGSNKGRANSPAACSALLHVKFVRDFTGFPLYILACIYSRSAPGCEKPCKQNSATRYVWSKVWGANCTQTNRLPVNLSAKCLGSKCYLYISQL